MNDAEVIRVIDSAAVEIADVVVGTARANFQNNTPSLVWNLNEVLTAISPMKQNISGAISRNILTYYEREYIGDNDNIKYI